MEERLSGWVHTGAVVLDIGDGVGALIVYTRPNLLGREIEVSRDGETRRVHTEVLEREAGGQRVFAAVFASLAEGRYTLWEDESRPAGTVQIVGGQVAEVDWR